MVELSLDREKLSTRKSDIAIIMGSPLDIDGSGSYYFPLFEDYKDGLLVDGDLKARAISQIYRNEIAPVVLVTGGWQDEETSRMEHMVQHAINQYGVPESFMIPLHTAPHSLGNLETAGKYLAKRPEMLSTGKISIWTIQSHLLRTEAFAVMDEFFAKHLLSMQISAVEDLLIETGNISESAAEAYHSSPAIQERLRSEGEGIRAIIRGNYQVRSK